MALFHFGLQLGPRIEVYRNQTRPLHVEPGFIHIRRAHGCRGRSVLVRSSCAAPVRYRSPSPDPQIIEVEPSDSYRRRYRSPAPSPEPPRPPSPQPREQYHTHYHHQVLPQPAPAPPPPPAAPPPTVNPLAERVDALTARNVALEAEMRELRDQVRTSRVREELMPRRCGDCGYTSVACPCSMPRSAMRTNGPVRRYSTSSGGGGNRRYDGARGVNVEISAPRPEYRHGVRWVDEVDWD